VPTTTTPPLDIDEVGDGDDEQLAYEFHEWTGQGRSILDGMLTRSDVPHGWQGATLFVREVDEALVDEIVAQAEIVAMPTLDLTQPTMVYELADLDDEQHGRLLRRLGEAGISHAFDRQGDLFVYERDEDLVDDVFARLEEPDIAEREFGPGVPGVDPVAVMSDVFVAAGRLRKSPGDAKARALLVEKAAIIEQMSLPYGIGADLWAGVVDRSVELSDAVAGEGTSLPDADVEVLAARLHDLMRPMV
jgi:hypothetical protein